METVTVESIPIVVGREEDGRWWADIESMPGVMAYGNTRDLAIAAVRALALRVARRLSLARCGCVWSVFRPHYSSLTP